MWVVPCGTFQMAAERGDDDRAELCPLGCCRLCRDLTLSSSECRGSPIIFRDCVYDSLENSCVCYRTVGIPYCTTVCQYTLFRAVAEMRRQVDRKVVFLRVLGKRSSCRTLYARAVELMIRVRSSVMWVPRDLNLSPR